MKIDDFEQELQRQSVRRVPVEWRAEILAAAIVRESMVESREQDGCWPSTLVSRLSSFLWPHPKAWAGLAAIWIVILAADFSVRDRSPVLAEKSAPPAPEVMAELRQQQRMLAELIGPRDTRDADRSKSFVPQPRSERVEILTA